MASASLDPLRPPAIKPHRTRPRELEDSLNHFIYHPLASRLARLLRPTGISPNAVSVCGAMLVWGAAWAYTQLGGAQGVLIGFVLHLLWHVFDGADGDLARLTGKSSPTGEMVDGVCDYAGYSVLYIALAALLDDRIGLWAWPLTLAAALSHLVQANHAETQRRSYLWRAYGVPWLKQTKADNSAGPLSRSRFARIMDGPAQLYIRVANAMAPENARVDAIVEANRDDPARMRQIGRIVRRASRTSLLLEKALGANPRTILLGASMALGSPLYFLLTEIVLLNLLLLVSAQHPNKVGRRLVARLVRAAS